MIFLPKKILAIGDLANTFSVLKKFTKDYEIHLINFPWDTASRITESDDVEFFDSLKIKDQVRKINSIKSNYELVLVNTWAGARIAYLCGLEYILFFVGSAIRAPLFKKNPRLSYLDKPLPSLNVFERNFYKKILDNAIYCGANAEDLLQELKKYRKKNIFKIGIPVDTELFHPGIKPLEIKKNNFTFLSPQRIGLAKGIDILWKAIELTKTDFEVIQVKWFLGQRTAEERKINEDLIKNKPKKVRLIPVFKRNDVPRAYAGVDAIFGQLKNGLGATVEREAAMCKRPVIQYADPKFKFQIGDKEEISPFLPHSNESEVIAELIDKIVDSKEFREDLCEKEYNFVKKIADPVMIAKQWENLFHKMRDNKRDSKKLGFRLKLRLLYFLIINRLYLKKIRKNSF